MTEPQGPRKPLRTHGRHCPCTACAREDWTNPLLAHCGMHGYGCPPVYAPIATPREPEKPQTALRQIAEAKRQISVCPTPGNCMYPQHHVGDESWVEFADRLQRMAREAAALAAPGAALDVERLRKLAIGFNETAAYAKTAREADTYRYCASQLLDVIAALRATPDPLAEER